MSTTVTLDGTAVLTQVNDSTVSVTATGNIVTSAFGNGTAQGSGTLAFDENSGQLVTTGGMTITFAPGDTLNVTFVIPDSVALNNISDTETSVTGVIANVVGGTGRFAGASGQFPSMSGTLRLINQISPNSGNVAIHFAGSGSITAPNYNSGSSSGLRFVPVTPCRVADTRNPNGTFGGPILSANSTRSFPVPASACGIPQSAAAYSLNVTVVPGGRLAYLTLWPAGSGQPFVSTLNSFDGRIRANAAIVPAASNGAVNVYVTDATHVILDINGYFESNNPSDLVFYPVTPCRVADTRNAPGAFGGPGLTAGQSRNFAIPSSACRIPTTARAYALNVTVVPSGPLGYLTLFPNGTAQPYVSTLNAPTGTVTANAAIVPAGADGSINAYATDATHLVMDIVGYFAPAGTGGLMFYAATPCRMVDTRNQPASTLAAPALSAGVARTLPLLTSTCSVPASAQAYSLNATVVPSITLAYLSLWPAGQAQPTVSTLNSFDGSITANAAILPAGNGGAVMAYGSDRTELILDLNGYFAP